MRAAAAAAELETFDGDHFDAGLAKGGVGADVALVCDNDPRLERHDVVAVIPLFALRGELVATGFDNAHLVDAERPCHVFGQRSLLLFDDEIVGRVTGPDTPDPRPVD